MLKVEVTRNPSSKGECIKVQIKRDSFFAKLVDLEELGIPLNILNAYTVERLDEQIIFQKQNEF